MARDLGVEAEEVHVATAAVLDFWFHELKPEQLFKADPMVDARIAGRFGRLRNRVLASGAKGWRDRPETLLAAIILLDQFSRNIYRGTPRAFEADTLAQELTAIAIDRGWDMKMPKEGRQFLYMPLQHAESRSLQALSLAKFQSLADEQSLAFAREHKHAIDRFGRFPTRNKALGRETTPEEAEWLRTSGVKW